jgi:hypothetical protein
VVRAILALSLTAIALAQSTAAQCTWTTNVLTAQVCTIAFGERSCEVKQYLVYTAYCDFYGGGTGIYDGSGDKGSPGVWIEPPDVRINSVSDEVPPWATIHLTLRGDLAMLHLYQNGYKVRSVPYGGDSMHFSLREVDSAVTQIVIVAEDYYGSEAAANLSVIRSSSRLHVYQNVNGTVLYTQGGEPMLYTGFWERRVSADILDTDYSVATIGQRNGKYEHVAVEDRLVPIGDTRRAAIETEYELSSYFGPARFASWECGDWSGPKACTAVGTFTASGSPSAHARITSTHVWGLAYWPTIISPTFVTIAP